VKKLFKSVSIWQNCRQDMSMTLMTQTKFWYQIFLHGIVATYARCGGIFNCKFIRESASENKNKNRLRFDKVTALSLVPPFLLGHGVYATYTCLRRKPVANAGVPCVG